MSPRIADQGRGLVSLCPRRTEKEIDTIMKEFGGTIANLRLEPKFKAAREEFDRLVTAIGKGEQEILKLQDRTDDTNFKIEIFDLPDIEQKLREITRSTGEAFQDLLGGEILNEL